MISRIERPFPKLTLGKTDELMLGANMWSSSGGPFMWRAENFKPDLVRKELRVLKQNGLNVTRSFFFLPDFMPRPGVIDESFVRRYQQFLDISKQEGLMTIPTFIVGHMSGQNFDIPWREGRSYFTDEGLLKDQEYFVSELTRRFKDHPAVAGWLLSNEMPLFGGATTPEAGKAWAERLMKAAHTAGATQPISTGDGAWGIEMTGTEHGFHVRDTAEVADFVGVHAYPNTDDRLRQLLDIPFQTEMSHFGAPVLTEEFGASTELASEKIVGNYYRQILNSTLLAGSTGWLAWNNTDFDLPDQVPYSHHPFEQKFGITKVDGTPKAPLREMKKFRALLDKVDVVNTRRSPSEVAVLVSSFLEKPWVAQPERNNLRWVLAQTYAVTKEADLGAAFVRESDPIPDAKLIIVPSTKALTGPTWKTLEEKARAGATVYASYFSGEGGAHRGVWGNDFDAFFGVEKQSWPGMVSPVTTDKVTWSFEKPFGGIPAGQTLSFRAAGNESGRSYMPVVPKGARVIARDQDGHPALLERKVGKGRIILSTYPVEYFAAKTAHVNPEQTYDLYTALAHRAGVQPQVTVESPHVMVDSLIHKDGRTFVWFMSNSDEKLKVSPTVAKGFTLHDLDSGERKEGLSLEPFGVQVLELRPA